MTTMPSSHSRWWYVIVSILVGTLLGLYLQRFQTTAPFMRDILPVGFNLQDVDLGVVTFGVKFGFRCNLGTIVGGVVGLWLSR